MMLAGAIKTTMIGPFPLFMLEMLHDVRHENVAPVKIAFGDKRIRQTMMREGRSITGIWPFFGIMMSLEIGLRVRILLHELRC
jgi:hypothetical protein